MGYATTITSALDALIAQIIATTSFTASNTSGAYLKSWQGVTYPVAMVRLQRDRMPRYQLGGKIVEHEMEFKVTIKKDGTGTQDDADNIISLAGEIVDKIESDINLGGVTGGSAVAEVTEVDYSLSEDRSAIFYYAVLTVQVRLKRDI